MNHVAVLDGQAHKNLRVIPNYSFSPFDGLGSITLFPAELDAAHKEFPIFIRKNAHSGQFYLSALLSSRSDANHFSDGRRWLSTYVPLMARRGPFLMSKRDEDTIHLCINLHDNRINDNGEPLFDGAGQPTQLTQHIASLLKQIHVGHQHSNELMQQLAAQHLIEPLTINGADIDQHDMLTGLYAVNADKLKQLPADTLLSLNKQDHLQAAYFIASSITNLRKLM